MGSKALVPRLRFPEFQNAPAWEMKALHTMSEHLQEKVGEDQLTPVSITAGAGFVTQEEKFGRDISGAQYRNYIKIMQGDFCYNKGNSKRFPQGCVYALKEFKEAAAPSAFVSFRLRVGFVNDFFQPQFERNSHGPQLAKYITSGARGDGLLNVSPEEFFSVELPVPKDKAEQQKIGDCLASLDEVIAAEGRKLEALRTHKKGLMQNLFPRPERIEDGVIIPAETTPRLRFPDFRDTAEWHERRLEEIAKRGSGHTPNKSKPEYYDGTVRWVSLADSWRLDRVFIEKTTRNISEEGLANSSAALHPAGTVLMSRDAGVGKSAIMKTPMAVSQHFVTWTCKDDLLKNEFLYYVLQRLKPMFESIAVGSTIKTIGVPFFAQMSITIPSRHEQQLIASCLGSLDTLITAQAKKLDTLKTHKQGLMQGLFPLPEVES